MRKFYSSGYQHVCQKTVDNGLIFLSKIDFAVFASIVGRHCMEQGISLLAFCIMYNHFHLEACFQSRRQMDSFMNGVTSAFARMYNRKYKLKGKLFRRPYLSAPKYSDKKAKENLFYILNNPVEKNLVKSARCYRWNFLKYLDCDYPFSTPLVTSKASCALLDLMSDVKSRKYDGMSLNYKMFDSRYYSLSDEEQNQFIDYCVSEYLSLDKETLVAKFGSTGSVSDAADTVMGSEYDLADDDGLEDYRHYDAITEILNDEGYPVDRMRLDVSEEEWKRLEKRFRVEVHATQYEIDKYFHRT